MTIYDLKPAFQNLLRPVCRALADAGVTANQVTLAALLLSVVAGVFLALYPTATWALLLVPIWLFLRMALNAIDGMLAREHDMQSDLGAVLNELGDVVADTAIYLPFALIPGIDPRLVVLIVVLSILTEMAGILIAQLGGSRRYDGPMGKSDRAFLFGLLALLLAFDVPTGTWLSGVLALAAAALLITVFNRCRRGLAEINSQH